ncbi:MAG TPA: HNH endonuclease [Cytophagaceae bacterium]
MELKICVLCEREVRTLTKHHLVPKEEGGRYTQTVLLCQPCHTTIHCTFSNKELAISYNNVQKLKVAPRLSNYLEWIKGKSIERIINKKRKKYKGL